MSVWLMYTQVSLQCLHYCLHPHLDSASARGWLYSLCGVSSRIPWDPSARPWLIPPLLHFVASLIHNKMLPLLLLLHPNSVCCSQQAVRVDKLSNQPQTQGSTLWHLFILLYKSYPGKIVCWANQSEVIFMPAVVLVYCRSCDIQSLSDLLI